MPIPLPDQVGWSGPPSLLNGIQANGAVVTPELVERINQQNYYRMLTGQGDPIEMPTEGEPLAEYATRVAFVDSGLGYELAEQAGIPREAFTSNLTRIDQEAQARRRDGMGPLQSAFDSYGNSVRDNGFFRSAAALAALGYGGAQAGAFGGTAGPGGYSAAGSAAGGGAAAADGLTPILAGNGNPAAVMLPGANSAVMGASNAAWGSGAIPGMTSLPSAIASPGAINAFTGVAPAAAGNWFTNNLPLINTGVNTLLGARAADQAADAETAAFQAAIEEQRRQFDTTRNDLMPWIDAGKQGLANLTDPNAFTASPGYEWMRNEGQRDIGNSFAARGGAASGNALRALTEFNSGLAAQDYDNFFRRNLNLAGLGSDNAQTVGSFGANAASNIGNSLANQGISRASGVMGKYGSIANGLTEGVSNWLYNRRRSRP